MIYIGVQSAVVFAPPLPFFAYHLYLAFSVIYPSLRLQCHSFWLCQFLLFITWMGRAHVGRVYDESQWLMSLKLWRLIWISFIYGLIAGGCI